MFGSNLLELVCAKNIEVKRKKSVETSLENIQPVVLPEVEAVQEFLVQEAGELLDRLNGSLSGKVVETVLSLARIMMCYLSGMQTSLVGGGVGQPNITAMLATLVKHIIIKAGEATEKVLCKRETRSSNLKPVGLAHGGGVVQHGLLQVPVQQGYRVCLPHGQAGVVRE